MDKDVIAAIEKCLAKGDRAEVIPAKEGVQVVQIHRKTIIDARPNKK